MVDTDAKLANEVLDNAAEEKDEKATKVKRAQADAKPVDEALKATDEKAVDEITVKIDENLVKVETEIEAEVKATNVGTKRVEEKAFAAAKENGKDLTKVFNSERLEDEDTSFKENRKNVTAKKM